MLKNDGYEFIDEDQFLEKTPGEGIVEAIRGFEECVQDLDELVTMALEIKRLSQILIKEEEEREERKVLIRDILCLLVPLTIFVILIFTV